MVNVPVWAVGRTQCCSREHASKKKKKLTRASTHPSLPSLYAPRRAQYSGEKNLIRRTPFIFRRSGKTPRSSLLSLINFHCSSTHDTTHGAFTLPPLPPQIQLAHQLELMLIHTDAPAFGALQTGITNFSHHSQETSTTAVGVRKEPGRRNTPLKPNLSQQTPFCPWQGPRS